MSFECYGSKRTKFSPFGQMEGDAIIKKAMFSVIIKTEIGGIMAYFAQSLKNKKYEAFFIGCHSIHGLYPTLQ